MVVLSTPQQQLATTAHDADVGLSFGGYFKLPKKLELSVRLRTGLQVQAFLPELNSTTPLPQQVFYGLLLGPVVELQSQSVPGFGARLDAGIIPVGLLTETPGLYDGTPASSFGYYFGLAGAYRILPGFELELNYRILSTSTSFAQGSTPERLAYDRDPEVQRLAKMGETLMSGSRTTLQHTLAINLVFFRR
jgi:hypothetical protein